MTLFAKNLRLKSRFSPYRSITGKRNCPMSSSLAYVLGESISLADGTRVNIRGTATYRPCLDLIIWGLFRKGLRGVVEPMVGIIILNQVRRILATLTIQAVIEDRERFSKRIEKMATPLLIGTGISLKAFSLHEIEIEPS